MSEFTRRLSAVLILGGVILLPSCSKEKKDPITEPPDTVGYEASATIASNQEATITTETGAGLHVPLYAVPPTEGGGNGTMVFSIEKSQSTAAAPPAGHSVASDVYRFGPDGFTFGGMVEVTVPVSGDVGDGNVSLFRINQTTGASEPYAGVYDENTHTITAQTYHLSPWFVSTYNPETTAWGAFKVTNNSATDWLHICVVGYELKYPSADANFTGDAWCMWAPVGTIGWASSGNWYLPQGTYRLCVSMNRSGTILSPPGPYTHGFVEEATLDQPWTRTQPHTTDVSFSAPPSPTADGPCDCTPVPSTSVGTGDVQVTLTWHSSLAIDLDLWVTEPNGTKCYYGNTPTTTGGTLDRDNLCSNYVDGRPENIFWSNAPVGEYKVEVDRFSVCGNNIPSQSFDVRVVSGGHVRTYTGSVSSGVVDVTRFTVTAAAPRPMIEGGPSDREGTGGILFGEYLGTVSRAPDLPPKD